MSLRKRVEDLARARAEEVARGICNIMIVSLQQSQVGAMTIQKVNSDGTVTVTLPDGSQQDMTYNGNSYPKLGGVVFQQGPGVVY